MKFGEEKAGGKVGNRKVRRGHRYQRPGTPGSAKRVVGRAFSGSGRCTGGAGCSVRIDSRLKGLWWTG